MQKIQNTKKDVKTPKIVILGGGFAGVFAYRAIDKYIKPEHDVKVTLINKDDRFLFVPLIHEVATGNLLPSSITQPLRKIAPGCQFLEAEATSVNTDKKIVRIRNKEIYKEAVKTNLSHEPSTEIEYDYLIMALGAKTNFANVPGAEEFSYPLYGMGDAKAIKNRIIESFERAQFMNDEAEIEKTLSFAVVGGGATGVEIAAEIGDFIQNEIRSSFGKKNVNKSKVRLIHRGDRLMEQVPEWFSKNALVTLAKLEVEVHLNEQVTEVRADEICIGENTIPARTIIWAAGVKAQEIRIESSKPIERDKSTRRIKANQYLQVENHPEIFAVGDQAWICDKENGIPYPMRAQFAVREGITAAKNIKNLIEGEPLREFHWKDLGFIVSLGNKRALASIYRVSFKGFLAWIFYRGAYLSKIIGAKAKIRTFLEWTMNLFLKRDVSKL